MHQHTEQLTEVVMSDLRRAAEMALEVLQPEDDVDPAAAYHAVIALRSALEAERHVGCLGVPVNTPVTPARQPKAIVRSVTKDEVRVHWIGGHPQIGDRLY